jgi:repressor LexA
MAQRQDLTDRQRQILDLITETVNDRGYPPSVREIGTAVGLSSPSTVHSHLTALERSGYLRRDPSKPRAIEVIDDGRQEISLHRAPVRDVPLVGSIAAGSPILADEDIEEIYPLPTELVGHDPVFMLHVRGDSMVDEGILDGDWVVIEQRDQARDGEIVVALIDGEDATLKRIEQLPDVCILHPANRDLEPQRYAPGRVNIQGVVVGQMRAY